MLTSIWRWSVLAVVLSLASAPLALAQAGKTDKAATPAEKIKAILDQNVTLDWAGQSFHELCNHLKDKTGVSFAVDTQTLQLMGLPIDEMPVQITIKATNSKLRNALQQTLGQYNLTYVILGETVLLTTEEMAQHRQLRQRITVNANQEPLDSILKKLARETAVNIVVDSKVAKEAKAPVSLQLEEEVPLGDALRLLTFMGGMRVVRVGSILFVTSAERAQTFPADPLTPPAGNNVNPDGMTVPGFPGRPGVIGGGFGGGVRILPAQIAPAIPPMPVPPPPRPDPMPRQPQPGPEREVPPGPAAPSPQGQ